MQTQEVEMSHSGFKMPFLDSMRGFSYRLLLEEQGGSAPETMMTPSRSGRSTGAVIAGNCKPHISCCQARETI
jgi:hypothetical protein